MKKRQGWSRFEQSAQQLLQLPALNVSTNERGKAVVVRSGERVFLCASAWRLSTACPVMLSHNL